MNTFGSPIRITFGSFQPVINAAEQGIAARRLDFIPKSPLPCLSRPLIECFYNTLNTFTPYHYAVVDIDATTHLVSRMSLVNFIQRHREEILQIRDHQEASMELRNTLQNSNGLISSYIYGLSSQQIGSILTVLQNYRRDDNQERGNQGIHQPQENNQIEREPVEPPEESPVASPQPNSIQTTFSVAEPEATEESVSSVNNPKIEVEPTEPPVDAPVATPAPLSLNPLSTHEVAKASFVDRQRQKLGDPVGSITLVSKRDHLPHTITIHKVVSPGKTEFFACRDWNEIGYLSIDWIHFDAQTNKLKNQADNEISDGFPISWYETFDERSTCNRIFINMIRSDARDQFPGIGSALMQVAAEFGLKKGCEGRIMLTADWSSHIFHYKMGLRALRSEYNQQIEAAMKRKPSSRETDVKNLPSTAWLGSIAMYMPKDSAAALIEKIHTTPILDETKVYLQELNQE